MTLKETQANCYEENIFTEHNKDIVFAEGAVPPSQKVFSNFEVEISLSHCDISCKPRSLGFSERRADVVSDHANSK